MSSGLQKLIMLPGPTNVHPRVMRAMLKPMINHRGPDFYELYSRIIDRAKKVFQTKGDVFVLTCSGTGGVDCSIGNVVAKGDKVIVPIFGLFGERMRDVVLRHGGVPVEIKKEWGEGLSAAEVEDALKRERDVKAIALVCNETSTGVCVRELKEIGRLAQEHGALLIVDAVSMLGGDDLPVDEWGIDLCVTGSQKCLACPPGLALISVSERAWEVIEKSSSRPYYFDLTSYKRYLEERTETPFTPSIPLFYALDEALAIIEEEGLENRFERHKRCARAFYEALGSIGVSPIPKPEHRSNTVICVKPPLGVKADDLRKIAREKHNVVLGGGQGPFRGKVFRIGCMGMISPAMVLKTLSAIGLSLRELGYEASLDQLLSTASSVLSP